MAVQNARMYFNNSLGSLSLVLLDLERNWEHYSLLEMIDIAKLPDEGNVNLINIPDLLVYVATIKRNYDLFGCIVPVTA